MMKTLFSFFLLINFFVLSGCDAGSGYADLDQFMKAADDKPSGKIEPLPEVEAYQAFEYSQAGSRDPFTRPVEVVLTEIQVQDDQSTIKPNLDRVKEVLEGFQLTQLKMVGTLQRGDANTLFALIADNSGGVHMVKAGQHIGTNYGRVVNITESRIDLIEIVPNGHSGWLERPRTVSLDEE